MFRDIESDLEMASGRWWRQI